jgi:aspartate/glutamate racemase
MIKFYILIKSRKLEVINPDDEQQKTDIMKNIFDEIKLSPSITQIL